MSSISPPTEEARACRRLRPSWAAQAFMVFGCLLAVAQAATLVRRVHTAQTDFSVFYRTARELSAGAGPELYTTYDEPTGFYHCIPPAGTLVFLPTAAMSPTAAAAVWSVLNLGLLALGIGALRQVFDGLDRQRRLGQMTRVWAMGVLLVLAAGSLQVGQFSVLFEVCWVLYLAASFRHKHGIAGAALAVPAAVKLYPLMLFAVPTALRWRRQLWWGAVALVVLVVALPAAAYGPRFLPLSVSFIRNILLSPQGRVASSLDPAMVSSQGIDLQLLRYLTSCPDLQTKVPWLPHADLPRETVLALAQAVRLIVLAVTIGVSWRWARRRPFREQPHYTAFMLTALWCAALYLTLPDTKSRYSAYLLPAFLPLLMIVTAAGARRRGWRHATLFALTTLCLALSMQFIPDSVRVLGAPLLATVAIWCANLGRLIVDTRVASRRTALSRGDEPRRERGGLRTSAAGPDHIGAETR